MYHSSSQEQILKNGSRFHSLILVFLCSQHHSPSSSCVGSNDKCTLHKHHGTLVTPFQLDHRFAGFVCVSLVTEPGTHHAQMSHPLCNGSGSTQGDWMYSKSVVPNRANDTTFSSIKERISASNIVDKHQQTNKKTDVTFHENPGCLQGSFYYLPKQYTSINYIYGQITQNDL